MTHTPGPWQSMPTEKWFALGGNQPSSICHVGDYTIATSEPSYEFHGTDENDARLIAAAPEMLAALRDLVDGEDGSVGESISRARTAIAKATGEP